ncbi:MAG: CCA tRNA nucleotidyltransferase [Chloroflexota bacterium]
MVGGSLRDVLLGREPADWDVATSAPPEAVHALFAGSSWENRFGTVTVRGEPEVQVTTYRSESGYSDRRRPDAVRWGTSLAEDLERRDFTINALAWTPDDPAQDPPLATPLAPAQDPRQNLRLDGRLTDRWGGEADLRAGVLRAVGDPERRFEEDALRLLRAVRFVTRLELRLDAATELAIRRHAPDAAHLSGERVRDELVAWLRSEDPPPSRYLALTESLGLLAPILPELAALRGVPQDKALAGDALDHSLRTVDALPATDPVLRLAGLLHDVGKATTLRDGHFYGHEVVGAELAAAALDRLRLPREHAARITAVIRQHMFAYDASWTDAAVRRFVKRVTRPLVDDLFALRRADTAASGARETALGGFNELAGRIALQESAPLDERALVLDGNDLMAALGLPPGPAIGSLLALLLERVLDDPALNEHETLLRIARELRDATVIASRAED